MQIQSHLLWQCGWKCDSKGLKLHWENAQGFCAGNRAAALRWCRKKCIKDGGSVAQALPPPGALWKGSSPGLGDEEPKVDRIIFIRDLVTVWTQTSTIISKGSY